MVQMMESNSITGEIYNVISNSMKSEISALLQLFPYATKDDRVTKLDHFASFTGGEWLQISKALIVVLHPFLDGTRCNCRTHLEGTKRPIPVTRELEQFGVKDSSEHTLRDHYVAITQVRTIIDFKILIYLWIIQEIWFAHHLSGLLVDDIDNFTSRYGNHLKYIKALYGKKFLSLKNHEPLHAELFISHVSTPRNVWAFGSERENCDFKQVTITCKKTHSFKFKTTNNNSNERAYYMLKANEESKFVSQWNTILDLSTVMSDKQGSIQASRLPLALYHRSLSIPESLYKFSSAASPHFKLTLNDFISFTNELLYVNFARIISLLRGSDNSEWAHVILYEKTKKTLPLTPYPLITFRPRESMIPLSSIKRKVNIVPADLAWFQKNGKQVHFSQWEELDGTYPGSLVLLPC
jgi:hypothetical protein